MTAKNNEATHALDEVIQSIHEMDDRLLAVSQLEDKSQYKHSFKKWYESMRAIHDIKRALHKVGKYETFKETDWNDFESSHKDSGHSDKNE